MHRVSLYKRFSVRKRSIAQTCNTMMPMRSGIDWVNFKGAELARYKGFESGLGGQANDGLWILFSCSFAQNGPWATDV
jgi:hypothetical protein